VRLAERSESGCGQAQNKTQRCEPGAIAEWRAISLWSRGQGLLDASDTPRFQKSERWQHDRNQGHQESLNRIGNGNSHESAQEHVGEDHERPDYDTRRKPSGEQVIYGDTCPLELTGDIERKANRD